MEYVEFNLLQVIEKSADGLKVWLLLLKEDDVREFTRHILQGLEFIHSKGIIHRDLKPENVLVNKFCDSDFRKNVAKICDFGLSKRKSEREKDLTTYIATRWYRPPEVLLGNNRYSFNIDIWALGCIMAEMILKYPIFPGDSEIGQLNLIYEISTSSKQDLNAMLENSKKLLGISFDTKNCRNFSKELGNRISKSGFAFLIKLLEVNPKKRIIASEALKQNYFKKNNFAAIFARGRILKNEYRKFNNALPIKPSSNSGNIQSNLSFNSIASDNNVSSSKSIISSKLVLQASSKLPRIFIPSIDMKRRTFQERFGKSIMKSVLTDSQEGILSNRSVKQKCPKFSPGHSSKRMNLPNSSSSRRKSKISPLQIMKEQRSREKLRMTLMGNTNQKNRIVEKKKSHRKNLSCQISSANLPPIGTENNFKNENAKLKSRKKKLNFEMKIFRDLTLPTFN